MNGLRRIARLDIVGLAVAGTYAAAIGLASVVIATAALDRFSATVAPAVPDAPLRCAVALAGCLPLYLWHLHHGMRGTRPPHAGWSLAALVVLVVGATPFAGISWLAALHLVGVVVLLTVRPALAVPVWLAVAVAAYAWSLVLGTSEQSARWYLILVALRSLTVFVLVWMVVTLRRLRTARLALADRAVARERVRVDGQLAGSVLLALHNVAEEADRAAAFAERDDFDGCRRALGELVRTSRDGLGEARRVLRGYRRTTLRGELSTAVDLLTAAGVSVRVELPADDPPDAQAGVLRAALRRTTDELLQSGAAGPWVISVTAGADEWELHCRAEPPRRTP